MAAPASPFLPHPCRVRRVVRETSDTVTLALEPPAGWTGFRPGQFDMLYVFGVGEVAISVSGDPARADVLVHTVRGVGSVTLPLVRLRRGDTVGVRGPYGTPWPVDLARGRDVVVVAGGIGLAPVRPLLHAIAADRAAFGRVHLLYGARSPDDVLYGGDVARWRAADVEVHVTVDHATRAWAGEVGVVTTQIPGAGFDPAGAIAFVCGPEVMMRFTAAALERRGIAPARIFVSLERNMKCAVALCGRCQLGPTFVCRDGPVLSYERVGRLLELREV